MKASVSQYIALLKICLLAMLLVANAAFANATWTNLLDAKLSHWDTYISFAHQDGYNGEPPRDAQGKLISPVGLNTGNDTLNIFTTYQENNNTILRISGEYYGAVTSKASYKNYHLTLAMRWGDKKWPPRLHKLKDSGILYHAVGEHGAEYFRSWMQSQEFQIMAGHLGDYWSQKTSAIDIRAYQGEYIMNPVADERQPFISVGHQEKTKGFVLRKENAEKPEGQWNTLELICFEGKSVHIVNGVVVMVLQNSRYYKNGIKTPLIEGKIQLQSEAAEVFYKDILIKPLDKLPASIEQFFD